MNAKSKLLVKYAEGVIEMNTTFAKEMRNPPVRRIRTASEDPTGLPHFCSPHSSDQGQSPQGYLQGSDLPVDAEPHRHPRG